MNIRYIPVFALLLLTSIRESQAQENERIYLDDVLASTTKKSARYYRVAEGQEGDLYIGRTYYIDGKLKSDGTYADPELQIEHGLFTYYHANGSVESRGEFMMGRKAGLWERYDSTGRPLAEKIYDPTPLENIIYTRAETMPSHNHGSDKEFIRYIKANVTPTKGKRVKGSVTTCFVVEKDGTLSDVKVVKGTDVKVNDQVVQAIRATAPWQPGTDKGQPVRVIVRMPVQF